MMHAVLRILHRATLNLSKQICHSFLLMSAIVRVHSLGFGYKTTEERFVTIVRHSIYLLRVKGC
jgi:hypothetical protein